VHGRSRASGLSPSKYARTFSCDAASVSWISERVGMFVLSKNTGKDGS
jgi:hypothetical protein